MKPLRVGCSGWSYESWRGRFYPPQLSPARRLEAYAESFDTVEVNATFYRLQRRPAVEHWVEATPPGFRGEVKVTKDRGRLLESELAPVSAVTIHPSAIFCQRDHEEREDARDGMVADLRFVVQAMARD